MMIRDAMEAALDLVRQQKFGEAFPVLHAILDNDPENLRTLCLLAQCHQ